MARRIEGTVAGGYSCDVENCGLNAIWAVFIATPYLNEPERAPIITMTDQHICHHHLSLVRRDLVTDHMRKAIRDIADQNRGVPDFERQRMGKIGIWSGEYHRAQEMMGLIAPGDQVIVSDAPPLDLG